MKRLERILGRLWLLWLVRGLLACSGAPVNLVEEPPPDGTADTCVRCDRVSHDAGRDRDPSDAGTARQDAEGGVHEPMPEAAPDEGAVDAGDASDPPDVAELDASEAGEDACCDAGNDTGPLDAGHDSGPLDAGYDAGFDDAGFDAGHDAGHDAGVDARPPDSGVDTGPADAKADAHDAGPPVDSGCTPRPKGSHACGYYTATTPADFCVEFGGTGIAVATPAACTCVSTYTCACLYANGIDTTSFCGGFYPSSCTDSPQGPFVVCP